MSQTICLRPRLVVTRYKQHAPRVSARVVLASAAQPTGNGPLSDARQPGELVTADVFREYKKLLASGLSPEAAEAVLESAEWTSAGPVRKLAEELKQLGLLVKLLLGLVGVQLALTDTTTLPNSIVAAGFKALIG